MSTHKTPYFALLNSIPLLNITGVLGNRSKISQSKSSDNIGSNDRGSNNYIVWGITDLEGNSIKLCLFGGAYQAHWKEVVGSVLILKNMETKIGELRRKSDSSDDRYDTSLFSVDKADQIEKIGTSADYRVCAGLKADGSRCSIVVHKRDEYCKYHLGQSLQAMKRKLVGGTRHVNAATTLIYSFRIICCCTRN